MTKQRPVLIVGGGLCGVTTFYELVSRDIPAILIERDGAVAQGTSYANGGVLHPSLPDPWNNPGIGRVLFTSLFDRQAPVRLHLRQIPNLALWGLDFLRNSSLQRHRDITCANFRLAHYSTRQTEALTQFLNLAYENQAPGSLKIYRSEAERREAIELADLLGPLGLVYEDLDQATLLVREPSLVHCLEPVHGALLFSDDRVGNARVFCETLAAQAEARGGRIIYNETVKKLVVENGRVVGVELGAERLFGEVVICTGVDAPTLVAPLGLRLPIRPAKGYSITLDKGEATTSDIVMPTHPILDAMFHIAITPLGAKLRVLGMAEFMGHDLTLDPTRLKMLRGFFERTLPEVSKQLDWAKAENWCGLRPMSSDGRPFIGPTPVEGVWLNCGQGHLGWTMAVGSARILADHMTGRVPEIDASAFAYGRARQL